MPRVSRRKHSQVGLHKLTLDYPDGLREVIVFQFAGHEVHEQVDRFTIASAHCTTEEFVRVGPTRITIHGEVIERHSGYKNSPRIVLKKRPISRKR